MKEKIDLAVKLLDLAVVPTSFVRYMRFYDDAGQFEDSKVSKYIGYGSAVGFEVCRLGFYFTIINNTLENLF